MLFKMDKSSQHSFAKDLVEFTRISLMFDPMQLASEFSYPGSKERIGTL